MIVTDNHVLFYGGFPSNFVKCDFTLNYMGETNRFFCTEQAFMWIKAKYFGDEEIADHILNEDSDPMTCKAFGRMVSGYDDGKWATVRERVMFRVNYEKYTQDKEMNALLMNPEYDGKMFVECSPSDRIWGIGRGMSMGTEFLDNEKNWDGRNLLGKVITQVRDYIKHNGGVEREFHI